METIKSYNKNFIMLNPNIKSNVQQKAPKTKVVRKEGEKNNESKRDV